MEKAPQRAPLDLYLGMESYEASNPKTILNKITFSLNFVP